MHEQLATPHIELSGGGPPPGGYGPPGGFVPPGGQGGGAPPGAPGGYGTPPAPPYGARPGFFVGYPQGGGYPGPMQPHMDPAYQELKKRVDRWFTLAIVSVFCGCQVLGIVNVVLAQQAKTSLERGDFADAESKIGVVKILCLSVWGLLALSFVSVLGFMALGALGVLGR